MAPKSLEAAVHHWCEVLSSTGKRPTGAAAIRELALSPSTAYRHVNSWREKQGNVPQPDPPTNDTVEAPMPEVSA